jgi:hypothetical protein
MVCPLRTASSVLVGLQLRISAFLQAKASGHRLSNPHYTSTDKEISNIGVLSIWNNTPTKGCLFYLITAMRSFAGRSNETAGLGMDDLTLIVPLEMNPGGSPPSSRYASSNEILDVFFARDKNLVAQDLPLLVHATTFTLDTVFALAYHLVMSDKYVEPETEAFISYLKQGANTATDDTLIELCEVQHRPQAEEKRRESTSQFFAKHFHELFALVEELEKTVGNAPTPRRYESSLTQCLAVSSNISSHSQRRCAVNVLANNPLVTSFRK